MNLVVNILLLPAIPAALLLAGYWLAARLTTATAAERLAVAVLAGLGLLLWNVAAVNMFRPLSGVWAWLCLWPIAVTLLLPAARGACWRDVRAIAASRRGAGAIALAAGFLLLLLWPLLTRPSLVFYDGTSNHDAFFWIVAAGHLMRHSYLELPVVESLHPLMSAVPAIIGWQPAWGRMGGEGLLALTSSLVGEEPMRIYLAATAALSVPWIAAVFLAVRTFLSGRLGTLGTCALIGLQPVFVFFHANANLPNLLGALTGATVVISIERALRDSTGRIVWVTLLPISVHGLLCSYPEMIPFVVLPAGLLWARTWFRGGLRTRWRNAVGVAFAGLAGAALNPASLLRAWSGFIASFDAARANQNWANLFDPLSALQYLPALATLSVGANRTLGAFVGLLLTALLLVGLVRAVRRAVDPVGAVLVLSGAVALIAYTLATGFNYGWQKAVQFGGALWAAFFPVAIIDTLADTADATIRRRLLQHGAILAIGALFAYATVYNCFNSHKWAGQKIITRDWFHLRARAAERLPGATVLVDGATFRMAFFHGMWATYFLPDNPLYFAARGHENGGYIRDAVRNESRDPLPPVAGVLVDRAWADTLDANSERHFTGDSVALLAEANRMMNWSGLTPENGLPHNAIGRISLDVRPHSPSAFILVLAPRHAASAGATWQVRREAEGQPPFAQAVSGPAPWRIEVPLVAGQRNQIELTANPSPAPGSVPPFVVKEIKIVDAAP